MSENSSSNKVLIILLILSVLLNAFLFFTQTKKSGEISQLNTKVDSLQQATTLLASSVETTGSRLETAEEELDEFKGLSVELDSLLDVAKKDIAAKESRINVLRKDASKAKELEKEMTELKALKERYLERIDSLISVNNLLADEIVIHKENIEQLTSAKEQLQKTVEKGSVLSADNVLAVPYKQKGSGKFVATAIASKSRRVEVCFDILENKIAQAGEKTVYLQMISPEGVTLGTDATGAGVFTSMEDNSQNRYTTVAKINYENRKKNYCVTWDYEMQLSKGNYTVKVFSDGFYSGVGAFILK